MTLHQQRALLFRQARIAVRVARMGVGAGAMLAISCPAAFAQIVPTGATVVGGQAVVGVATVNSAGGLTLGINQATGSAVINWNTFNIGALDRVNIIQLNAGAALLNRVTGGQSSTIAGSITANGQVYLVNPNGITITPTGTINTAAFVASTLDFSGPDQTTRNAAFMSGSRNFTAQGNAATVSNLGTITAARGGYIALIGGTVENYGTIIVPMGRVALGAGEQATLDLSGDGFLQVTGQASDPLVSNLGTISASGGLIQLTAAAAQGVGRRIINLSGTLDATGVSGQNGNIVISSNDGDAAIVAHSALAASTASTVVDADTLGNALAGANVTLSAGSTSGQNGNIDITSALAWTAPTGLTLAAAADIRLQADVTATHGSLSLGAGGLVTPSGAISIGGVFDLTAGSWIQNGSALPAFYARDFRLDGGSFLRVAAGDGSGGNPYLVQDIYGMQGIGSSNSTLAANWILAAQPGQRLDATGTANWNNGLGFKPIGQASAVAASDSPSVTGQGFSGSFDGNGNVINGLVINRPGEVTAGLFGINAGVIANLGVAGASVTGGAMTGGLAGYNSGTITQAYYSGTVAGADITGGLVGANEGMISNAYASGAVSGATNVGGLVGLQGNATTMTPAQLHNTYASGSVTGNNRVGALLGANIGSGATVSASFWNTTASGITTGMGLDQNSQSANVTALTGAQINDAFSFIDKGWDFTSTWAMAQAGGSPVLRRLNSAPVYDKYVKVRGDTSTTYGDGIVAATGITISGPDAGDVSGIGWGSAVSSTMNAGTYAYAAGNVIALQVSGGTPSDYFVSYGTSALTVNKRAITVTADSLTGTFGNALPVLTYTIGGAGLVNHDRLAGNLETTATSRSLSGLYAILLGTLGSANYDIAFQGGTLSMTGTPGPGNGTQASATGTIDVIGHTPLRPTPDEPPDRSDARRVLIADPRYDGAVVCLPSGGGCAAAVGGD